MSYQHPQSQFLSVNFNKASTDRTYVLSFNKKTMLINKNRQQIRPLLNNITFLKDTSNTSLYPMTIFFNYTTFQLALLPSVSLNPHLE